MLCLEGHDFVFEREGLEKDIWECKLRCDSKCWARIHTNQGENNRRLLKRVSAHNHEQREIREDINLPVSFQRDARGYRENNLPLFDSGVSADKIIIFGSAANVRYFIACDTSLVDDTFKVAPSLFDQVFVIHEYRNGNSFPLLSCLTPNRTTTTYNRVLASFKAKEPLLNPQFIMSNFEKAFINAFEIAFPRVEQKRCYFYFSQATFRKIQLFPDLFRKYSSDPDFQIQIRHFNTLVFIPTKGVRCVDGGTLHCFKRYITSRVQGLLANDTNDVYRAR
ncbi:hypothetical protein ILUMI_01578 [Ignelater luminosus]|uniref:MULE transposase domain-containing protein n=1 Tax=Ignelater luminosus TaxID=2038154 RepID=A0A8K0DJV9_IGNLU|nr:hypothetical protein ILUMI_01578 [Ignelater luminosus]